MIAGLVIGKEKSIGYPGKNTLSVLGRPMVEYAFLAAANCRLVEKIFTSTDSAAIAEVGNRFGAELIERPPELATPDALTEDALIHAFDEMQSRQSENIDIVVLLFANSPTIRVELINEGIDRLIDDETLDSAFSVCKYNMWSPVRARGVDENNLIQPYVDLDLLGEKSRISSIRGAEGDCYYCDLSVQIMRDRCFTNMDEGALPFKWMGRKSYALINDYGFDVDFGWQVAVIEHWLVENGFSDTATPYDNN